MIYASLIYFLAVVSPGPNFVLVSRYSSMGSFKQGFAVTLGICTVSAIFSTISLLGLAATLRSFPYFTNLSVFLGSSYLIFIALSIFIGTFKLQKVPGEEGSVAENNAFSFSRSYRVGTLTNLFNMKTIAFMISIFSGFLAVPRSVLEQISIVFICSSLEFFWYSLVAFFFGRPFIRKVFYRHRISIDRSLALFLVLFAAQNVYHII